MTGGDGRFDALVVADSRFAGGSTSALVDDVRAMDAIGMKLGLLFVRSAYLDDSRDAVNPKAEALCDLPSVTRLEPGTSASAPLAFLHHPQVFFQGIEETARLRAEKAVIVAHQPPFREDGSLEYDPIATSRRARKALGLNDNPWFGPVSGVVRSQLASFAPLVRLTSQDWPNIFDGADWVSTSPIFGSPDITIGRHGRAELQKFPTTGAEIDASLPAGPGIRVRVLGCPTDELVAKGAHPDRWDVLPFGSEPAVAFLNSLDVFTYHYHKSRVEAFGRTVVEALLCGRACLLDPRLEVTFGDLAEYCAPSDTRSALMRMAETPDRARQMATERREKAIALYGRETIGARLKALAADRGQTARGASSAAPWQVARKMAGLYRRRAGGAMG